MTEEVLRHVCGLQGFGRDLNDRCPACDYNRAIYEAATTHEPTPTNLTGGTAEPGTPEAPVVP